MISRIFLATALLLLSACAGTETITDPQAGSSSDMDMSEMEELFNQRQEEARSRYSQADVDFMSGMIGDHAQALIMSELSEEAGASGPIRILTARIINAQKDEIATMQKWLEDRGQPVPQVHIDGLNLMVHGAESDHMDHTNMPGMLSKEQLEELASAKGADFDRLFLTYMIQHHEGATSMVDTLFKTDGAGNDELSFKIASDINVDQLTEIARMELMLEEMKSTGQN